MSINRSRVEMLLLLFSVDVDVDVDDDDDDAITMGCDRQNGWGKSAWAVVESLWRNGLAAKGLWWCNMIMMYLEFGNGYWLMVS